MTRRRIPVLSAAICIAVLAGCSATSQVSSTQDSTKFTVENTDRFAALDPAAEAAVKCTGLQERTLGDGRLEVVANVKNRGGDVARVQVQCLFMDGQGEASEPEGQWQSLAIAGDSTTVVRFTASNASAKKYSIRARSAP
jgi:uncharacterized protein YcfL